MWSIPVLQLITFVNQIVMFYWAVEYKSNAVVSHIFNPIQFILILYFLYQNIENPRLKLYVPYLATGMVIFSVVNSFFLQSLNTFPSNFLVIANLVLITIATVLFLEKLDSPSSVKIFQDPVFIIGSAVLLFNAFSFLFFLLTNYLRSIQYSTSSIYYILLFANILYYSLLFIASFLSTKQPNFQSETSRK